MRVSQHHVNCAAHCPRKMLVVRDGPQGSDRVSAAGDLSSRQDREGDTKQVSEAEGRTEPSISCAECGR